MNLTFGVGQHPYLPLVITQQVVPSGHWDLSGQTTAPSSALSSSGALINVRRIWVNESSRLSEVLVQRECSTSHFIPSGQQCEPSEQHVAYEQGIKVLLLLQIFFLGYLVTHTGITVTALKTRSPELWTDKAFSYRITDCATETDTASTTDPLGNFPGLII